MRSGILFGYSISSGGDRFLQRLLSSSLFRDRFGFRGSLLGRSLGLFRGSRSLPVLFGLDRVGSLADPGFLRFSIGPGV
jgi:hypothetical protein